MYRNMLIDNDSHCVIIRYCIFWIEFILKNILFIAHKYIYFNNYDLLIIISLVENLEQEKLLLPNL